MEAAGGWLFNQPKATGGNYVKQKVTRLYDFPGCSVSFSLNHAFGARESPLEIVEPAPL